MSLRGNIQHGQRRRRPFSVFAPLIGLALGLIVLFTLLAELFRFSSVLQITP